MNVNLGMGTGINLRGLGSDATLVLLNGHRLSQTGAGNFVDVSQIVLIPAIEPPKAEILTNAPRGTASSSRTVDAALTYALRSARASAAGRHEKNDDDPICARRGPADQPSDRSARPWRVLTIAKSYRGARLARIRCRVRRCMLSRRAVSETLRLHIS